MGWGGVTPSCPQGQTVQGHRVMISPPLEGCWGVVAGARRWDLPSVNQNRVSSPSGGEARTTGRDKDSKAETPRPARSPNSTRLPAVSSVGSTILGSAALVGKRATPRLRTRGPEPRASRSRPREGPHPRPAPCLCVRTA